MLFLSLVIYRNFRKKMFLEKPKRKRTFVPHSKINGVLVIREREKESLPVNSDTIVSFIVNIDKRLITFANMNSWARPLSIYGKHALCSTQPCIIRLLELQPQRTMILMKKTNTHTHTNTHLNCKSSPSPYEHFLWGRNVLQVIM